jgi:hypothetical protein
MKVKKSSQKPESAASPRLAPDHRSPSMQLYGFEDGPIKSMDGVNDPVFDLLMFGRSLYNSGVVDSIQDGIEGAFKMVSKNPKYSIKQLMDRLPNTVGAFVAGESLEDMLFNDEEE